MWVYGWDQLCCQELTVQIPLSNEQDILDIFASQWEGVKTACPTLLLAMSQTHSLGVCHCYSKYVSTQLLLILKS